MGLFTPNERGLAPIVREISWTLKSLFAFVFSIFGSISDTWYLSGFVPPTQGLVFVAKFLGGLRSKN